jgi:hypothetical protein
LKPLSLFYSGGRNVVQCSRRPTLYALALLWNGTTYFFQYSCDSFCASAI